MPHSSSVFAPAGMNLNSKSGPDLAPPALTGSGSVGRAEHVGVVRAAGEFRLLAIRPVAAGERLFRIDGEKTVRPSRFSVQIAEALHLDLGPGHTTEEILDRYFWRFMNHSCAPNVLLRGQDVIAGRPIGPWTAITYNYNSTEWDMAEPFDCQCGSPDCLGKIRGFKHLTPEQRAGIRPIAAPHLERRFAIVAFPHLA